MTMNWLQRLLCGHAHVIFSDHAHYICTECGQEWEIPVALRAASGVYKVIEDRIRLEEEYEQIIALVEKYVGQHEYDA